MPTSRGGQLFMLETAYAICNGYVSFYNPNTGEHKKGISLTMPEVVSLLYGMKGTHIPACKESYGII